jgi:hypothetical protein
MTLENLLYNIGKTAIRNKVINYAAVGGSIYELNAENIVDYPLLFASPTGQHEVRTNTTDYEITLYYLDRLLRDKTNDVQIFSTAVEQLKLIMRMIENIDGVIEVADTFTISNFSETERMNDSVAGAFATVTITTMNISECNNIEVIDSFTKLQEKTVVIDANGEYEITYDSNYEGLSKVEVIVDVTDENGSYDEGYDDGKADGLSEGYDNGYSVGQQEGYQDGYSVGQQEGYQDGYQVGQAEGVEGYIETLPTLSITQNGSYNTINKGVNVNVVPTVNVGTNKIKFAYSTFSTIPEFFDFEGVTDGSKMFNSCSSLTTVPALNFSSITNMSGMFQSCSSLTTVIELRCENCQNMSDMFYNCSKLTTVPDLNSGKNKTLYDTLGSCSSLVSVGTVDCTSLTDGSNNAEIFGSSSKNKFTNFGGLINLKCKADSKGLSACPNLSYQSCINVLNGLYDFTGNGRVPNSNQGKLKVHPNFLTTVGDEISIGLDKGWTITS